MARRRGQRKAQEQRLGVALVHMMEDLMVVKSDLVALNEFAEVQPPVHKIKLERCIQRLDRMIEDGTRAAEGQDKQGGAKPAGVE